jgi:hypothetical protein
MLFKKSALVVTILILANLSSFSQDYKANPGPRFSSEDVYDILVFKSKQQKTKGFIALIGGPAITAAGIMVSRNLERSRFTGFPVSSTTAKWDIGNYVAVLGVITTLSSVPLFLSSAKYKRAANLLLTNQGTTFLDKKIPVPGISLRISF